MLTYAYSTCNKDLKAIFFLPITTSFIITNQKSLYNSQLCASKTAHHTTLPGPWSVNSASASSLQTSYCALLYFPSKICNKHTNNYGVTKEFRKYLHFQNSIIWKFFTLLFWGSGGSCPYFRTSSCLPQALLYLSLHRHPYATLKKYPRESRKPKTFYTSPITTFVCTVTSMASTYNTMSFSPVMRGVLNGSRVLKFLKLDVRNFNFLWLVPEI